MSRTQTAAQAARNRLGGLRRTSGTPEQIDTARRELAEAKIAGFIRKTLADAPPLADDQVARLRALLPPADAVNGAGN